MDGAAASALAAALALSCAPSRTVPAGPLDCPGVRDRALRACVDGFRARADETTGEPERSAERSFALRDACPYAAAVAWSGCERGAFERFAGRSALGRCGDEVDYVEASILTSCMRARELPARAWNALVRRCFDWASAGRASLDARCAESRARPRGAALAREGPR